MEESLRLAYLAAMDIPVWLLRAADPLQVEFEPTHSAPVRAEPLETVAPVRAHRARDLLGDSAPLRPAASRAAASRERPVAQTPAVALASLWQRHDRPAEALTWARRAMTTPAGTADPWWLYWRGDLRHASARLAVLRATTP